MTDVRSLVVGATTPSSARVVAAVDDLAGVSAVRLAVADNPAMSGPTMYGPVAPDSRGIAHLEATGLDADRRWWYALEVDSALDLEITGQFRTLPPVDVPASFRFGSGHCAGSTGAQHVWVPNVSNAPVFDRIRRRALAEDWLFFSHLGDLHYRDIAVDSIGAFRTAYDDVLFAPRQHALYRSVATAYMYDDHDFGPNNSDSTGPWRDPANQAYRERWPHWPLQGSTVGVDDHLGQAWQVGRVQFVLPDVRSFRDPNGAPDGPAKTMLGTVQKAWLDDLLETSTAAFLVFLSPSLWNEERVDSWGSFPHERAELVEMFGDHGWLDRMIALVGDRHALGIDDGSRNPYGGFPVYLLGSLDSAGPSSQVPLHGTAALYYSLGAFQGSDQWGSVQIQDHGDTIEVDGRAFRGDDLWRSYALWSDDVSPVEEPTTVEILAGGWWVDITGDVYDDGVTITRGQPGEGGTTDAGTCTLTLDNRDGRFTPHNPASPFYGLIGRNVQLRVRRGTSVRFHGEIASLPQTWNPRGTDVRAPIEAAGVLRRIGQADLVESALRRMVDQLPGVSDWWPLEDDRETVFASSAMPGGVASTFAVLTAGDVDEFPRPSFGHAGDGVPPGAAGAMLLPPTREAIFWPKRTAGAWTLALWLGAASDVEPCSWSTVVRCPGGTIAVNWSHTGGVGLFVTNADGGSVGSQTGTVRLGPPTLLTITVQGTNQLLLGVDQVDGSSQTFQVTATNTGFRQVDRVTVSSGAVFGPDDTTGTTMAVSHVAFGAVSWQTVSRALIATAGAGHAGEPADQRAERLCNEAGVPFVRAGGPGDGQPMGVQRPAPLLTLLRECAATDRGILYEPRHLFGIGFRTRPTLYNQHPHCELRYGDGVLGAIPAPVEDDQHLANDITVSRDGGASSRVVRRVGPLSVRQPPDGVGRYDASASLSLWRDQDATQQAGWRLHLGTVDEPRFPALLLALHQGGWTPELLEEAADLDVGDRLVLTDPPAWLRPEAIDTIALGFAETLGSFTWEIQVNTRPARPWQVWRLGDAVLSRVDSDGTTLAAPISDSATVFAVEGDRWVDSVDHPAAFPFDVVVAGERMTVAGITDGDPQEFTVARSTNGVTKAHGPGAAVRVAVPARVAL